MKTKNIEAMRQFRLMITEVGIPLVTATTIWISTHPDTERNLRNKAKNFKNSVSNKFKKKDFKVV